MAQFFVAVGLAFFANPVRVASLARKIVVAFGARLLVAAGHAFSRSL